MNAGYLIAPLIVAVAVVVGASLVFIQQINLTGSSIYTAPENLTNQTEILEKSKCPATCDDNNTCTSDWCNETSSYTCVSSPINGPAENCFGSPVACQTNSCVAGKCTTLIEKNCCGNEICELNEGCLKCPADCGKCPTPNQSSSQTTSTTQPEESTAANTTQTTQNCDPSYPDVCIPSPPPDLDCKDVPYKKFRVLQPDPHRFDGNKNGIGCES